MIEGLQVVPLKRIPTSGDREHMLRATDPHFRPFVRSISRPSTRGDQGLAPARADDAHYACVSGRIKLVLYDDREDSNAR